MKNKLIWLFALLNAGFAFSQKYRYEDNNPEKVNTYKAIVFSDKYEKQYLLLRAFLKDLPQAQIITEKYNGTKAVMEIVADSVSYQKISSSLPNFGNVQFTEFKKADITQVMMDYNSQVSAQQKTISEFSLYAKQMDTNTIKQMYYLNRVTEARTALDLLNQKIKEVKNDLSKYKIKLEFNNAYLSNTDFDEKDMGKMKKWVNMPGAEFSFLNVELPKIGLSAPSYQGVQIKYIFTRGKDYLQLGAWKNVKTISDSSTIKEMFFLSAGQDFYSKRWGKGSRKVFNLYSGYNAGLMLLNNDKEKLVVMPQISPCIGIDLFKTKHVLLDTRVSYFLPISLDYYRHLRGFTYSASFNFVF